jgi:8-oxo-dGTP pyrophosphatase MutT (NUDIX family)
MKEKEFILALRQKLKRELPGYSAQKKMEPPLRNTFDLDSSKAKKAATILILYFEKEWKFILIKRSSHPLDKHKGQISFPGGSLEKGESSELAAIREAEEEIGVHPTQLEILGKLTDLFIPISNFKVSPYVAIGDISIDKLIKQESEVAEILTFSLKEFLSDQSVEYHTMTMANGFVLKEVPVFKIKNSVIWGATAMMLSEFKQIVKSISN